MMFKFYAYIAIAVPGIILSILFGWNQEAAFLGWIVFVASTISITFKLFNLEAERQVNITETPKRYIERKSSFSADNMWRSALLVLAGISFVSLQELWWLILPGLWFAGLLTVIIPLRTRNSSWDIVREGLYQEYKEKLTREDIEVVVEILDAVTPKQVGTEKIASDALSAEEKQRFLNLYLKFNRELGS